MSQEDSRSEFFVYIGVACAVAGGLFAAQIFYGTYIDMSYHAQLMETAANEPLLAERATQREKLDNGKLPIEQAKALIAQRGRVGIGTIAPVQSDDLSAVSGWIRKPGFQAAVAHPIRVARAPIAPVPAAAAAVIDPNAAPDAAGAPGAAPSGTR